MKSFLTFLVLFCFNAQAEETRWNQVENLRQIPSNIIEMSGVFKGRYFNEDGSTNKPAYMIAYPLQENGQWSGRYNIFILNVEKEGGWFAEDQYSGRVLEGYRVGGNRLGLLAVGTNAENGNFDSNFIDIKTPPVGILEVKFAETGPTLCIEPTGKKESSLLHYEFNKIPDYIRLGPNLPKGAFKSSTSSLYSNPNNDFQSSSIRIEQSDIGLKGSFYTLFELTGMMVMRQEQLSENLKEYSEQKISGLMVSIIYKGKQAVLMSKIDPEGQKMDVELLRKQ